MIGNFNAIIVFIHTENIRSDDMTFSMKSQSGCIYSLNIHISALSKTKDKVKDIKKIKILFEN